MAAFTRDTRMAKIVELAAIAIGTPADVTFELDYDATSSFQGEQYAADWSDVTVGALYQLGLSGNQTVTGSTVTFSEDNGDYSQSATVAAQVGEAVTQTV